MNISFIGFGNMAKAIAKGLVSDDRYHIRASSPSLTIGKTADGIHTHSDNLAILSGADVIILAVKPVQIAHVIEQIKDTVPDGTLIISVAAGISIAHCNLFGKQHAIVRAMPNVGASVGKSATPLFANKAASETQKQMAEAIFNTVGLTTWVTKEADMDAFTALSGSGPAYVLLFMEAMTKAAISLGLEESIARKFALQTVNGSLTLALQSDESFAEQRRRVTSPGGTTAAALNVFESSKLCDIVAQAMNAAVQRAKELDQI